LLGKSAKGHINMETISKSILLMSGVKKSLLSLIVLAVLAVGLTRLARKDRTLLIIIATPFILQVLTVMILRPNMVREPYVFVRYIAWELPLLSLSAAIGLSHLRISSSWFNTNKILDLVMITAWITLNPICDMLFIHNNFIIPYAYERTVRHEKQFIPRLYYELAKMTDDFSIAEMPWEYHKHLNRWMDYQLIHKKNIYAIVGSSIDPNYHYDAWLKDKQLKNCLLRDDRLHFRKFINLTDVIRNPSIRFIILHKSPNTEYRGTRMLETGNNCSVIRDLIEESGMRLVYRDNLIEAYRIPLKKINKKKSSIVIH